MPAATSSRISTMDRVNKVISLGLRGNNPKLMVTSPFRSGVRRSVLRTNCRSSVTDCTQDKDPELLGAALNDPEADRPRELKAPHRIQ